MAAEEPPANEDGRDGDDENVDEVARPTTGFRIVEPGSLLGRYRLLEELGTGGMATVYRARDQELRREVAVKVLFPHLCRQTELVQRFSREARAAAALEHPNILRVYDVGGGQSVGGDPPHIVMELIRGLSLRELVEEHGPIRLAEVVAGMGALLADALATAHRAGVIHRDVKPANVMAADDGRLLLADFGVAHIDDDDGQLTRTGALLGTPAFMSPEQAVGEPATVQGDLYSLGVTLYVLATGGLPGNPRSRLMGEPVVSAARRRPEVGSDLARVLSQLMAIELADRPATADAAASILRELAAASGFTDPRAEVASFLANPSAFDTEREPAVLQSLVARATDAASSGDFARSMALADRAAALAPRDPAATALMSRLAQHGSKLSGRRVVVVGGAVALSGAAIVGVALAIQGSSTSSSVAAMVDAAVAMADASVVDARADASLATPIDAAPTVVAMVVDARPTSRASDARSVAVVVATPVDASPVVPRAPDAALVVAPLAPGSLVLIADTWCDLFVDGTAHGRADRQQPVSLAAGVHKLRCSQGPGLAEWAGKVTIRPGATSEVRASLLTDVAVLLSVSGDEVVVDGVSGRATGTRRLSPGRHRIEVRASGRTLSSGWVTIPRVASCTLKDSPLDCFAN